MKSPGTLGFCNRKGREGGVGKIGAQWLIQLCCCCDFGLVANTITANLLCRLYMSKIQAISLQTIMSLVSFNRF